MIDVRIKKVRAPFFGPKFLQLHATWREPADGFPKGVRKDVFTPAFDSTSEAECLEASRQLDVILKQKYHLTL